MSKRPIFFILYLVASIGLAATGGYLYFSTPDKTRESKTQSTLGFVKPQGPDVRVRGEDESMWNKISRDANVYQNDRIFTGQSSTAVVNLNSHDHLTVEPNSLIKISDQTKLPLFDIHDGGLFGELKKNAKFLVKSGNHVLKFESHGAVIQLRGEGDNVQLTVLKGEAVVKRSSEIPASASDSKADSTGESPSDSASENAAKAADASTSEPDIVVSANQQVSVSADQNIKSVVHEFKVTLLSPPPAAVLWESGEPVKLAWEKSAASANAACDIEISTDPQFLTGVTKLSTRERSQSIQLKPVGVYFWRVVNPEGEENSPTSSFSLYALQPPVIEKSESFELKPESAHASGDSPMELHWTDPSLSDSYRVEISTSTDFTHPLLNEVTTHSTLKAPSLKAGDYFWRVTSRHTDRDDLTSVTGKLSFRLIAAPVRIVSVAEPEAKVETEKAAAPERAPAVADSMVLQVPTPIATPEPVAVKTAPTPAPLQAALIQPNPAHFELVEDGLDPSPQVNQEESDSVRVVFPKFALTLDPTAERSELQWSETGDFASLRFIELTRSQSEVEMHHAPENDFFVRVLSHRGREITVSRTVPVKLRLSAPLIQSSRVEIVNGDSWTIETKIKSHSRTKKIRLQVCDDLTFGDECSITDVTVRSQADSGGVSVSVPIASSGEKFLRAESLGENGAPISAFSPVTRVNIEPSVPPALSRAAPKVKSDLFLSNSLEFEAGYSFSALTVNDKTSLATADLQLSRDVKVGARASQHWTQAFSSIEEFSLRSVDFQPSTNSAKGLSNTDHVLPHLALGFENKFADRFSLRYSLGMENNLALHGLDSGLVSVDSVAEPFANLQATARLWKLQNTELLGQLGATYLMGAQTSGYALSSGYAANGTLLFLENLSTGHFLEFSLRFQERQQNTSVVRITEQNIGFSVEYVMPLPGSQP